MGEPAAIRTERLRKTFGPVVAVEDVSLQIAWGETFGLLGTNGAGKSTLIRVLTTLLVPTSGKACVAGCDVQTHAADVRRAIGVVPQAATSDPELTAGETLEFQARLYRIGRAERKGLIPHLIESVRLTDVRDRLVGTFSGGMRRRLEIARGLIHQPRILFLDEPTTGLDPVSRVALWEMIRRLKEQTRLTIVLTTHYMDEADQLCDRIAIIDHGLIVAQGTPAHLKAQVKGIDTIEVHFEQSPAQWHGEIARLPGVVGVRVSQRSCAIESRDRLATLDALLAMSRARGVAVESLDMRGTTLDDVFIHCTGTELGAATGDAAQTGISHPYERRRI